MTTDEARKLKNREKTRRYRAMRAGDLALKARETELKRKWSASRLEQLARKNRERYHNDPARKKAACEYSVKWREENPERWLAAQKAWRAANRDKLRANYRRHIEKKKQNPECADSRNKRLAAKRAYYQTNKEKLEEQRLKRHAKNPERNTAVLASRRAKKIAAMPKWVERKAVREFYRAAKAKTKETGIAWNVDHIIPLKHPLVCGLHAPANLQLLPALDNKSKSNRFVIA